MCENKSNFINCWISWGKNSISVTTLPTGAKRGDILRSVQNKAGLTKNSKLGLQISKVCPVVMEMVQISLIHNKLHLFG